jgi:hypothetical protein
MANWEYRSIQLNYIPQSSTEVDALNDVGKDGWELVSISANKIAYLKRRHEELPSPTAAKPARRSGSETK